MTWHVFDQVFRECCRECSGQTACQGGLVPEWRLGCRSRGSIFCIVCSIVSVFLLPAPLLPIRRQKHCVCFLCLDILALFLRCCCCMLLLRCLCLFLSHLCKCTLHLNRS